MSVIPSRLHRLTHSLQNGQSIFAFLQETSQVSKMIAAADKGLPSVVGISQALLDQFGPVIKQTAYKQFTGMAIRWILEQHSFRLLDQGVKISSDPVFASGSRYVRLPQAPLPPVAAIPRAEQSDLLERLISVLSEAELHHLIQIGQEALAARP